MSDNVRRSIYLTPEMAEQIDIYANSKCIPFNQAVRQLVEKTLSLTAYSEGENTVRQFIHEEVNNSLGPYMSQITGILEKRIIPICAKASRTSYPPTNPAWGDEKPLCSLSRGAKSVSPSLAGNNIVHQVIRVT